MTANEKEIRMFSGALESRKDEERQKTTIEGTPIVFEQKTDLGMWDEVIDRGALDKTDLRDVRLLINHDTSQLPLARSRNNNANSTMQLKPVENGMEIRVDLDIENNQDARTLYSAVKRGDITGMSFMFTVDKSIWEEEDSDNPLRRIAHIDKVFEVSAVAFPAYDETSLQAASIDSAPEGGESPLESALRRELQEVRERKQTEARRRAALEILRK